MLNDHVFLSRPHRIIFGGFESNTYRLQQAGWEFAASQRMEHGGTQLIMKHEAAGLYGVTDFVGMDMMRAVHSPSFEAVFNVVHMTTRLSVTAVSHVPLSSYRAVDMTPCHMPHNEIKDVSALGLFHAPKVRTQEVFVDQASVPDLMALILERQQPAREEHFRQQAKEQHEPGRRREAAPVVDFHAQIVSVAA